MKLKLFNFGRLSDKIFNLEHYLYLALGVFITKTNGRSPFRSPNALGKN